mmetsp:Transcript_117293/g.239976  ORF Transcript_117293/g.239976 Transcript_117293/m.239976 type:complete len:84 (-) Transcript_117293:983-1234(-)
MHLGSRSNRSNGYGHRNLEKDLDKVNKVFPGFWGPGLATGMPQQTNVPFSLQGEEPAPSLDAGAVPVPRVAKELVLKGIRTML